MGYANKVVWSIIQFATSCLNSQSRWGDYTSREGIYINILMEWCLNHGMYESRPLLRQGGSEMNTSPDLRTRRLELEP